MKCFFNYVKYHIIVSLLECAHIVLKHVDVLLEVLLAGWLLI